MAHLARYTIHLPESLNDGSLVPPEYFATLERDLVGIAGGFTRASATGGWRGGDQTYREPVTLYFVDTDDDAAGERLLDVAQRVARELAQEAVYVTRQEIDTFVVAASVPATPRARAADHLGFEPVRPLQSSGRLG